MSVSIKTAREIDLMREAGRLLEKVHNELAKVICPGISTWEIDHIGEKLIRDLGCVPNFLHYNGYPASICVSVNDEVVHGIPSKNHILREGDIVSLDAGLIYKGFHSDAARTHAVGQISPEAQKLIDVTRQCFLRESSMPGPAAISMRFQQPSDPTRKASATVLSGIWWVTESAPRCMRIRRFPISRRNAGESG